MQILLSMMLDNSMIRHLANELNIIDNEEMAFWGRFAIYKCKYYIHITFTVSIFCNDAVCHTKG